MSKLKITERTLPNYFKLKDNVDEIKKNPIVKVGLLSDSGLKIEEEGLNFSGLSVADVGAFHEFGTPTIPQRSFLRGTLDNRRADIIDMMNDALYRMAGGNSDGKTELGRIGIAFAGMVKKRIAQGISPELTIETIRRKTVNGRKGTTPLIDTGQLRQSITSEYVESDSGGEGEVTRG